MVYVIIISLAACLCMILLTLIKPKIKIRKITIGTYWLASLAGAILLVLFGFLSLSELFDGLTTGGAINPLKILILFISMTILSIFLDETGFFRYLANVVLKKTGSSQLKLFTAMYIAISILTVFTSNDIIILTFTPFICYFSKNAKINPVPHLVSCFVAANTASMLLIIGNPTNIFLATANGIEFLEYLKVMLLPTIFAVITAYLVMLLLFYKKLKEPIIQSTEAVTIKNKTLLIIGAVLLCCATLLLAISSYINVEMWIVAVVFAVLLLLSALIVSIAKKAKPKELAETLKRTPWELIPFVISMFAIVLSLEKYNLAKNIASFLDRGNTTFVYGIISTLFSNLINNIPMSVFFSSVVQNINPAQMNQAIYAVIIGSNIGAILTPIGALAGIMWLGLLKNNNIEYSYFKFLKYGIFISIPVLFAALTGLIIVL